MLVPARNILLLTMLTTISVAQTDPRITSIKAPSMPAAMILGAQPNSIASPKSWEAMETAVFTNFLDSNNNFVIPNNYALEFTPYWATKDRKMSMEDFLLPSPKQSLIQNLSLSLSSTKSYLVNDTIKSDALGLGVRTMIWEGTKNEKELIHRRYQQFLQDAKVSTLIENTINTDIINAIADKEDYLKAVTSALDQNKATVLSNFDAKFRTAWIYQFRDFLKGKLDGGVSLANVKAQIDDLIDEYVELDQTSKYLEKFRADRKGFKLEIAGAMVLNFPTRNLELSYCSKYGFWITPSWQPMNEKYKWIEFMGVLRYYGYNDAFYKRYTPNAEYFTRNTDYGLKLVLKWQKISFDMEVVGRSSKLILSETSDTLGNKITVSKTKTDCQIIGTLSYKIDDNLTLTYNIGKQFQPVINYKGNLISVINLNFGFGGPRRSDIQ